MASGYTVMSTFNSKSKNGMKKTSSARFKTRDILVKSIYSSDKNFYPQEGIEQKAAEILAVGLLSNLVVVYDSCDKGEYRLISGERRWRSLCLLIDQGYKEFEKVTCQVRESCDEHEEMIQLIIANSAREKDMATLIKEEQMLKQNLEYMRDNDMELNGYNLKDGRLRDVIADILNVSKTKVAEMEAISNRLISFFKDKLEKNEISASVAYQISKMSDGDQYRFWNRTRQQENITISDVTNFLKSIQNQDTNSVNSDVAPNISTVNKNPLNDEDDEDDEDIDEQIPGQMLVTPEGECTESEERTSFNSQEEEKPTELSTKGSDIVDEAVKVQPQMLTSAESVDTVSNSYDAQTENSDMYLFNAKISICNELIDREIGYLRFSNENKDTNNSKRRDLIHQITLDALRMYKHRLEGVDE